MPSTPPEGWLSVGHLRRPHGLRGDVFVQLTTDRVDRLDPGSELFGAGRTFTVDHSRRAGNGRLIAKFHEIADRTDAERVVNTELFGAPIDDPDALWVHDLIGRHVVDQHGVDRGACTAVVDNPAADLLELADGSLVPMNFVTEVGDVIAVDVPDGLFDHD
ncbi:MAG: ribosome maturation factor RimM [Actinomycetota bacterium]